MSRVTGGLICRILALCHASPEALSEGSNGRLSAEGAARCRAPLICRNPAGCHTLPGLSSNRSVGLTVSQVTGPVEQFGMLQYLDVGPNHKHRALLRRYAEDMLKGHPTLKDVKYLWNDEGYCHCYLLDGSMMEGWAEARDTDDNAWTRA